MTPPGLTARRTALARPVFLTQITTHSRFKQDTGGPRVTAHVATHEQCARVKMPQHVLITDRSCFKHKKTTKQLLKCG